MNEGPGIKQQIVERIKGSTNILVTVSTNPSVDDLSAALGLTLMLNIMDKHATAVMSGDIPPAISFLDPEKTFENTVDSLRDFIIALDKEKADHLRYKVDGDVVKIFITPYRTTITQDDLDFSQGDYNVELVLALGAQSKEHLDSALTAHGRILHDATVATLSCGETPSDLGSLNWHEPSASSLSEMLVSLSEAIKGDKPILDEQIATALLTGIVAATDRFSNNKTSSKVMTMAAQLMAAGANQQLIASKLEAAHEIGADKDIEASDQPAATQDGMTELAEGESSKVKRSEQSGKKPADGTLAISHQKEGTVDEVAAQTASDQQDEATKTAEDELAEQLDTVAPVGPAGTTDDLARDLEAASDTLNAMDALAPTDGNSEEEPELGGTLNATAEQAAKDKALAERDPRNHTILSHDNGKYVEGDQPTFASPFNSAVQPHLEPPTVDVFDGGKPSVNLDKGSPVASPAPEPAAPLAPSLPPLPLDPPVSTVPPALPTEPPADDGFIPAPMPTPSVSAGPTLEDIDRQNRSLSDHADAQAAVAAAFDSAPFESGNNPVQAVGAQPLGGDLHSAPASTLPPSQPSVSTLPPLPDFSTLPPPPTPIAPPSPLQGPLPPEQLGQIFGTPPAAPQAPEAPKDPNQFKIPGQ